MGRCAELDLCGGVGPSIIGGVPPSIGGGELDDRWHDLDGPPSIGGELAGPPSIGGVPPSLISHRRRRTRLAKFVGGTGSLGRICASHRRRKCPSLGRICGFRADTDADSEIGSDLISDLI